MSNICRLPAQLSHPAPAPPTAGARGGAAAKGQPQAGGAGGAQLAGLPAARQGQQRRGAVVSRRLAGRGTRVAELRGGVPARLRQSHFAVFKFKFALPPPPRPALHTGPHPRCPSCLPVSGWVAVQECTACLTAHGAPALPTLRSRIKPDCGRDCNQRCPALLRAL